MKLEVLSRATRNFKLWTINSKESTYKHIVISASHNPEQISLHTSSVYSIYCIVDSYLTLSLCCW
jgi:hypothetical protein